MLNLGFREMNKTKVDPSHLDAAKTWAHCRLEERDGAAQEPVAPPSETGIQEQTTTVADPLSESLAFPLCAMAESKRYREAQAQFQADR